MKRQSKKERQQDKAIEATFCRVADRVQINILDIPKVFAAGRAALEAGQDLDQAIIAIVRKLRVGGREI